MKVTRNADIDVVKVYDEDLDYRDHMAKLIKLRKKLAPVLIELTRDIDDVMVNQLCDYLELGKENVIFSKSPLDFSYVFDIQDIFKSVSQLSELDSFKSYCKEQTHREQQNNKRCTPYNIINLIQKSSYLF